MSILSISPLVLLDPISNISWCYIWHFFKLSILFHWPMCIFYASVILFWLLLHCDIIWTRSIMDFLVAQMVKCLPAMLKTWVWSLGQEDPLEKEMATHSSTLAWKIPWTEWPGRLQSGVAKSWTRLSFFTLLTL